MKHIESFQFSIDQGYFHYSNENDLPEGWIEIGKNIDRIKAHRFSKDFYEGKFSVNSKEELLIQWENYSNQEEYNENKNEQRVKTNND